jgi:hypothetical protein
LHRAKVDSRLFDGTAWYLQTGVTISSAAHQEKTSFTNLGLIWFLVLDSGNLG